MSDNSIVDQTYFAHEIVKEEEEKDIDPQSQNSNAIDDRNSDNKEYSISDFEY